MKTKLHDEREVNTISLTSDEAINEAAQKTGNTSAAAANHHKKKYHFSAMYAASMWHNPVQYVRPQHGGIKP
jgi:hypothetical protein